MKRFLSGWVALSLLVCGAGRAKADYVFTTIDPPGSTCTFAKGINNAGQVVGLYCGPIAFRGFLLSGDRYTSIDGPSAVQTEASGINDAGQIVGVYFTERTNGYVLSNGS